MSTLQRATTRLLLLLLLSSTLLQPAMAAARQYTIAAQPLSVALSDFSRQSGLQVSLDARLAWNKVSSAVDGQFTVEEAIERLLQGTGLEWRKGSGETLLILDPQPASNAILLPSLKVTGEASAKDLPYQTPGSVNVLSQRDVERFRGTSVGDIFQGMAGVLVGENRNSGGLDVNIRGMQGQGRVPVLVDGSRQETTVYRGYSGVSSRSYVDPDLIGSIKVEKGPVMTAEGTGATGGVVSMRTLTANDIIRDGKDWGIRLRGTLIGNNSGSVPAAGTPAGYDLAMTSNKQGYRIDCLTPEDCLDPATGRSLALPDPVAPNETMNRPGLLEAKSHAASLALARRFDWGDLLAAYTERSQGNYYAGKNGPAPQLDLSDQMDYHWYKIVYPQLKGATRFRAEERIVNSNYKSNSLLLKGQLYLPADQSWELSYLSYDSEYGELMPSQLAYLSQIRQTSNSTVEANTYTSRYHWDPISNDLLDLKFNLWHTNTLSDNANYSLEETTGGTQFIPILVPEIYQRTGGDLTNSFRFYRLGETRLDVGFSYQMEDVRPDAAGITSMRDGKRNEFSGFVALQYQPVPEWTLDAGLRYTRFSVRDHKPRSLGSGNPLCTNPNANGVCIYQAENDFSGTAPIISLTWEPVQGIQLYARHAEALRMPSLFENTSGFSVSPTLDMELKPEHARNREVGLNILRNGLLTDNDRFRFKLAWFRNKTDDYITRTPPNLWDPSSGQEFFVIRNIERASFHGYELSLDYDLGWFYTQFSGTRYNRIETCFYGSYLRYTCTDYGIPDSYINNMLPPPYHGSATFGTRLFQEKLELGVRGTFMGKRNTPEGRQADRVLNSGTSIVFWHSYQVYDFFASYQPNNWLAVDFNIDNLTDQYYLDALSLGLVPAPGRTARLSFTLSF